MDDGKIPILPSQGDIDDISNQYALGVFDEHNPSIFGIAAPDENGETKYLFFRMYKNEKGALVPIEVAVL